MKRKIYLLGMFMLLFGYLKAQPNSSYSSQDDGLVINQDDIIDALKVAGIEIHKFSIGPFEKEHKLSFFISEYQNDSLIYERQLYSGSNMFTYFDEDKLLCEGFISKIRVITKEENEKCSLSIGLEGGITLNRDFVFEKTYDRQFFLWKPYKETIWITGQRVPLMSYISSWKDESGHIRHCGVRELKNGHSDTRTFYKQSPSYFIISYLIENQEKKAR